MKEIPAWMKDAHLKAKCDWSKAGSPGTFYEWLLERSENELAVVTTPRQDGSRS